MDTDEALVEISGQLTRANDLVVGGAQGGETEGRITWAQTVLEERLGGQALEPLPSTEAGQGTSVEHLARAAELADEHLGDEEADLRLKRAIHEALSSARR